MDAYEDRRFRTHFAVGLFVIATLAGLAFVAAFFLSKENPLGATFPLEVRFSDVAGLKSGAPVTLMGAAVGRVEGMRIMDPEPPRFQRASWAVALAIRDEPWIRAHLTSRTTFIVQPESLFGNKYVNASFGEGGAALAPGSIVEGAVGAGIDARTFDKLSIALENLSGAAAELRTVLAAPPTSSAAPPPNLREVIANLDTTLKNTSEASQVLKEALSEENQEQIRTTFDDLSSSAKNLSNVTERMKTGMDSWADTLDKMRFWKGWFGNDGKRREGEKTAPRPQ